MGVAYTMVDALKHAGKSPTRASLLKAAQHLNEVNPFMRAGVKIATSPTRLLPDLARRSPCATTASTGWRSDRSSRRAAERLHRLTIGHTRLQNPPFSTDMEEPAR